MTPVLKRGMSIGGAIYHIYPPCFLHTPMFTFFFFKISERGHINPAVLSVRKPNYESQEKNLGNEMMSRPAVLAHVNTPKINVNGE